VVAAVAKSGIVVAVIAKAVAVAAVIAGNTLLTHFFFKI
jgi:hypothetical protein